MNQKVKEHFRSSDPVLYQALEKIGELEIMSTKVPKEYFLALCREIIAQQLSSRVAEVILGRFEGLFPRKTINPRDLLALSEETLRSTGMSWAKARFLKDLALKVESNEINFENLIRLENEEVIKELTKVKGIGRWTAEMFLIFCLGREDIFSFSDMGLRKAIKGLYQLENPTQEELGRIVVKWSPFRSYACRILWKYLDKG